MEKTLEFTQYGGGRYACTFTAAGGKSLIQVIRQKQGLIYIEAGADTEHLTYLESAGRFKDVLCEIEVPAETVVRVVSHTPVEYAAYMAGEEGKSGDYYTKEEIDRMMASVTQLQADWNQTDPEAADYIKGKPTLVERLEDLSDVEISPVDMSQQNYFEDAAEDYDGNLYDAVIIGDQVWLAQNLKVTHFNDGTPIDILTADAVAAAGYTDTGGYAYPNNDPTMVERYGLLYPIYTNRGMKRPSDEPTEKEISPIGWHLPSKEEWDAISSLGTQLYSDNNADWTIDSSNYSNATRLTLVPSGEASFGWYGSIFPATNSFGEQIILMQKFNTNNYAVIGGKNYGLLRTDLERENTHRVAIRCVCDLSATEFRSRMALKGKILIHNGDVWTDSDIPAQIQSDWSQTTNTAPDYIKNKPDLSSFITLNDVPQEVLVCTFADSTTISCDKTVAQIYDAWYSNKEVIGTLSTSYYRLGYITNTGIAMFFSIRSYHGVTIDKIQSTDGGTTWTKSSVTIQETLVSSTNIKTINGTSILGSGNIITTELPAVTASDNGKTLLVDNGEWQTGEPRDNRIPAITPAVGGSNSEDWTKIMAVNPAGNGFELVYPGEAIEWFTQHYGGGEVQIEFKKENKHTCIIASEDEDFSLNIRFDTTADCYLFIKNRANHKIHFTVNRIQYGSYIDVPIKKVTEGVLENGVDIEAGGFCLIRAKKVNDMAVIDVMNQPVANPNFTHTANTTVSDPTATITFPAYRRCTQMITVSADLGVTLEVNNLSDNYLWIKNDSNSDVDITVTAVTHGGNSVSNIYMPADGIIVPANGVCEIGILVNTDGAFISSRNDLTLQQ